MRPIDADELSDRILYLLQSGVPSQDIRRGIKKVYTMLCDTPTIEAEQVKRAQWIHHAGMNSKCSCCGRYFPVAEFEQRPFDVNFCIHCGAKMDGGINNE